MATTTYLIGFQHISDKDVDPGQEVGRQSVRVEADANASDDHLNALIVNAASAFYQTPVELEDLMNISIEVVAPHVPLVKWEIDDLPTIQQQFASPWSFDGATVRYHWADTGEMGVVDFMADRRANEEQLLTVANKALDHEVLMPRDLVVIDSVSFNEY
ncbi:hypothetical protein KHQ84_gp189 [Rhodococcus phage Finch]|uniref:Uncharacterized protein n=1 Tax=Rhodococcus phage Finch TaxID=2094144 RepID=A0A2P1JXV4_9CAUD|nr:hypothetical protein KHQ84_gp189 [Rhodococcus phage Finch]AVO25114.1 hypothetical protein SEA_FINCH_189 [Rhodococcus phage Finch]